MLLSAPAACVVPTALPDLARPLRMTADFAALGTTCRFDFECQSYAAGEQFKRRVRDWVAGFEQRFSRFLPDSLVSRINRAAGRSWIELDDEAESLFALCDWFHWTTRGVFDPAILPLLKLWDYHNPLPVVPDAAAVTAALAKCGWGRVRRQNRRIFLPEEGMGIDVGGIGKEYAVDRVIEIAAHCGIVNILVNFGHDLRVAGAPPEGGPWRIGLDDPTDPGRCWAGVAVRDRAVTTSGDYIRNFRIGEQRYGHILDPRTGYPVANGTLSVSVIAPTCTEAGILSTAAFILGADEGPAFLDGFYQAEGCIWHTSGKLQTRRFDEYVIRS